MAGGNTRACLVHPTGRVSVHVGTADHGQGHATSYAQIAADTLGLRPDDIDVVEGDTARVEFGQGTFNSRSLPVGGSAVHDCCQKVLAKARRIAAHMLTTAVEDVRYEAAVFTAPQRADGGALVCHGKQVARVAHFVPDIPAGLEPGLDERVFYDPKELSFPFGTYVAVVEVDPATGDITIDRFLAVDDCGPLLNPLLARGQVHGGIAQGLGQALLEGARYDDNGSLASHNWRTYAFPRAQHIPRIETAHTVTPSPFTAFGVKGIGEAGAIGAPPAIVNAVLDALAPLGVTHLDMPLHPEQILAAIRQGATAFWRCAVIPASFDYLRPDNVAEALEMIARLDEAAMFLAGGHALLPERKLRHTLPAHRHRPRAHRRAARHRHSRGPRSRARGRQ